ncbi:MAG TPA: site-specific integrase [Stellaceae bacterium]|nr:site-specific integrase [Stellaceae bacterium]
MASIRKRTWKSGGENKTAWIADYFDQAGKRHIKTFSTRKAADAWLVAARSEVADGTHTPDHASITVAEAGELWIQTGELEKLERSTLRQYRGHLDLYIKPAIGATKLARLSTPAVETFRDGLLRNHSRAMARKVLASLKSIISEAQRRGLVARNAALPVKIDAKKREQRRLTVGSDIPSKEEIQAILAGAEGRWRPFFITAVFTGMRASELRGLRWSDVDFERKVVRVRQRANLWGEIGAPKSAAGQREIPMSPMVVNTLREWRLACPKGPLNLVFPNGAGKVESHANIANRGFYALQRTAGMVEPVVDGNGEPVMEPETDEHGKPVIGPDGEPILRPAMRPKYGVHALRHFFASWAIERGFSPKKLQALLGHSSIQMTFDRYGHLFPSLEDDHAKFAAGEAALLG